MMSSGFVYTMINNQDFAQFLVVKKSLDKNSVKLVFSRYNIFVRYLKKENKDINKESIEAFIFHLKEKDLKNSSINSYIFMLRYLYAYIVDRDMDMGDFTDGIDSLPKKRTPIFILSPEEVDALLTADLTYGKFRGIDSSPLNGIYKTFTKFLIMTGARFEEASSLPVRNIDTHTGRVTFTETKNGEYRNVYINGSLLVEIKEMIRGKKNNELVFTSFIGSKIIPQNYNGDLKRRAKKAGITKRVHPHLLRHTYATHLYIATHDIGLVQVVLGHKDIKSTMIYIHLADEVVKNGMMLHPFARQHTDPSLIVEMVIRSIEGYNIQNDRRFNRMKVVEAINTFTVTMYRSLGPN